jgi:MFS family permease
MTEWGASLKWRTLLLLSLAELLAMGLWFSASAVTPVLIDEWRLTTGDAAWLTMSVQIGFVVGALLSALFNVADIWAPRKVVAAGALAGAGLNALIPLMADGLPIAIALRFGTGMTLAAVYPVGMKIMATWTKEDRGLGLGLLVGALTIGSASPHFIRGLGGISQWEPVMLMASALAAVGGIIAWRFGLCGNVACASRISDIWATCGNCTQCGHGFRYSLLKHTAQIPMGPSSERSDPSAWPPSVRLPPSPWAAQGASSQASWQIGGGARVRRSQAWSSAEAAR